VANLCTAWYRIATGKGQRTRELTTTCNGRHRRAGDGLRSEEYPKKSYEKEDYTMKALNKKILTVCLALMMAVVFAVPTFAAWVISVDSDPNMYINIEGSYGSAYNKRYITLYRTTQPNKEQQFKLYHSSYGFSDNFVLCTVDNPLYAFNRNGTSGRAWLWPLTSNGYDDSRLCTPQADSALLLVSFNYGGIGYVGRNLYFGQGITNWYASGTPVFPLTSANVDANPYC